MKRTSTFGYLTIGLLLMTIAVLLYSHVQLKQENALLNKEVKTLNVRVDTMADKTHALNAQIEQLKSDSEPKFQELIVSSKN